jgi:hypothetical protein
MTACAYPPATPFVIPDDHPNQKAHEWLAAQLDGLDWDSEVDYSWLRRQGESLLAKLDEQSSALQIEVLKACLERMLWLRQRRSSEDGLSTDYYIGSVLYDLACALYARRLAYSEDDICQILRLSRHTCGHGSDVTPPFDIAVEYARANGISVGLFSALRDFMDGLKSVGSAQVTHLKRKGGLLFVLDAESNGTRKSCWSDRFRAGLSSLAGEEQARWRQLVLNMTVNDVYEMPKVWRREAAGFVAKVRPEVVVQRLSAWWPDPKVSAVWPIQTGGSHLLKYFVWLLSVTTAMTELEPTCVELVRRLSELDWKPRERAQKVMIAAAFYLRSFPPEVSWPSLRRLAQWSAAAPGDRKGDKIREILQTYRQEHELELPELVEGQVQISHLKSGSSSMNR